MIGIVILNYNGWKLCIDCIESIKKTVKSKYRIYLVDNASTEKMTHEFEKFLKINSNIIFLNSNKNNGYSAGNNIGIKSAIEDGCEEILISNNDVIFMENTIDKLQNVLKTDLSIGIVGPKVYLPSGDIQEINMGCKMTMKGKYLYILRKTPLKKIAKNFLISFHAENENLEIPFEVFGVSGCCFMMSNYCSRKVFPLDENTFLYEEENILACIMEKIGKKTLYYSPATVIHIGGASTKKMSDFAYSCFVESEIYYCRKYLNASIIKIFPLYFIRTFNYIKLYKFKNIFEFIKRTNSMLKRKI